MPEDPDSELVSRVRAGDEGAFAELAGKYQDAMLSIARGYVPSGAVAEEVVQEAWIGVLRGIGRFERRSSFRTWLFRFIDTIGRWAMLDVFALSIWVAVVKPGKILFEMEGVTITDAKEAMRLASHKLPLRTTFVKREVF